MPSKDIKIPGTLHSVSDQYEADYKSGNYDDSSDVSDPEEPSAAAAADGNNNSPSHVAYDDTTDSDEYQSDLDPDVPRHPEAVADAASSPGAARKRRRGRKRRGGDGAEDDDDSYEASSSSLPAPDELLVRAKRLAAKFADRRQWNNAMRQLVRQTALCVLVHGPQHFKYAEAYTELARGYLDYKGPSFAQQAEEHAEHAKNILLGQEESMEGSAVAGTAEYMASELTRLEFLKVSLLTYHTLGRAQSLLKKFPDAEQSLIKAEKIVQELSKLSIVKHDFLLEAKLKIWTSLAKINAKLSKPMASVSYYEQAIAACEKRYGKGSHELVPLYQGVGATEQARPEFPNHEKAIEMYLKAHEIATAHAKGEFTEEAAGTARSLATAYAKCGDVAAQASAESYMQECLTACLQLHGPEHPSVCEAQDELAKLLIRAEKVDEGARLLQENVKVKARVHGDFSPQVLDSYRLLGSLWLSQGRLEKALQDLQRAFDIAEVLHGPGCRICRELQPTIDTVLKHPSMEGKQAGYEMKNRPRFNGIVARSSKTAGGSGGSAAATGVFN